MSTTEPRDEAHFARLAFLKARIDQEFGPNSEASAPKTEERLLALLDGVQTLLADMQAERDAISAQLQGSASGLRANAAYRTSAGLGPKTK